MYVFLKYFRQEEQNERKTRVQQSFPLFWCIDPLMAQHVLLTSSASLAVSLFLTLLVLFFSFSSFSSSATLCSSCQHTFMVARTRSSSSIHVQVSEWKCSHLWKCCFTLWGHRWSSDDRFVVHGQESTAWRSSIRKTRWEPRQENALNSKDRVCETKGLGFVFMSCQKCLWRRWVNNKTDCPGASRTSSWT